MTGLAAAIVEAWHELRIHKLRVLLSLIGVGVAVCALTTAVALAGMAQQAMVEQSERQDGRPATFGIYAYSNSGEPAAAAKMRRVIDDTMSHFGIDYHSMVAQTQLSGLVGGRTRSIDIRVVDPPYADMRRLVPEQGRWFEAQDAKNLSPAIVVDSRFIKALGLGPGALPATVTLGGERPVTATIIGQVPSDDYSDGPLAYVLPDSYDRWFGADQPFFDVSFQMWVPVKGAKALGKAVKKYLRPQLSGSTVEVHRQDFRAGDGDPYKELKYVGGGISVLILLLGALSLLNIALVTIKQRVREIGIRRSFGATTGRVFFSVMMESVVATFVAGVIGVVTAVGVVNSSFVAEHVISQVTDVPPFPISAAIMGLLVSLGVGALAGLLPALVAVRVRIIDAIRF